jgi:23S rRNA (cytosine1962-C5)-methyltransferase
VEANPDIDPTRFEWLCEDVFDIIEKIGSYDIILCDPPPFARKKGELEGALAGYKHLNEKAFRMCSKNGFLFTFSCSGAVSSEVFRDTVREAGLKSGRIVRIVRELHADVDHTVSLVHPEGEYLKGLMLHVE